MNNIEIFKNEEFGEIRTIKYNGVPWFVGKDVTDILGYQNGSRDINRHIDEEDRHKVMLFDGNQDKETIIINESGLYSLILSSKLSTAKKFKRWVTSEVLPQIRSTGGYIPINENETTEEFLARALIVAQNTLEQKDKLIAVQQKELESKDEEIEYKENVIIGLVDNIDLATKRQRINQILRRGCGHNGKKLAERWNLLYTEFSKKYHVNLNVRFDKYKSEYKPRLKNRLDVIDRHLNMIPEVYEIACKLFENDYHELMKIWESAIK